MGYKVILAWCEFWGQGAECAQVHVVGLGFALMWALIAAAAIGFVWLISPDLR